MGLVLLEEALDLVAEVRLARRAFLAENRDRDRSEKSEADEAPPAHLEEMHRGRPEKAEQAEGEADRPERVGDPEQRRDPGDDLRGGEHDRDLHRGRAEL